MTIYLILCRSLTNAQKAAKTLERAGFTVTIVKAPQGLSPIGCGYALTIRSRLEDAKRILRSNDIPYGKIFLKADGSEYREVSK